MSLRLSRSKVNALEGGGAIHKQYIKTSQIGKQVTFPNNTLHAAALRGAGGQDLFVFFWGGGH